MSPLAERFEGAPEQPKRNEPGSAEAPLTPEQARAQARERIADAADTERMSREGETRLAHTARKLEVSPADLRKAKDATRYVKRSQSVWSRIAGAFSRAEKELAEPMFDSASFASADHPDRNDDRVIEDGRNFGVFDGAAGKRSEGAGAVASRIASESFAEKLGGLGERASEKEAAAALREAFMVVHEKILAERGNDPTKQEMATTADVTHLVEDAKGKKVVYGHIGDSRIYRLRAGALEQMTIDHDFVGARFAKKMQESPDKAAVMSTYRAFKAQFEARAESNKKFSLSEVEATLAGLKAKGIDAGFTEEDVDNLVGDLNLAFKYKEKTINQIGGSNAFDVGSFEVGEGDAVMIVSDGVTKNLSDAELAEMLKGGAGAKEIAERANGGPKKDDVSAVVFRM